MGDWIDKLEDREQRRVDASRAREESRRLNDRLIQAKAPKDWVVLLARIKADAEKLGRKFPDDPFRRLDVTDEGYSCELYQPRSTVKLSLNLAGYCIDISQQIRNEQCVPPSMDSEDEIRISVDADKNTLFYTFKERNYTFVPLLAEQLVKLACGIVL